MSFSAGDVNIYRYCGNNPLNGTDAMGLCPNYTISLGFRSDGGGGGGAYDSNGNPIPNPGPEHAPTSLDPSGPTLPDGNEPGIAPPGYSGSYTGTAALDTDGGTPAAGEGSNHQSGTSLPGENADSDDYSVRNANSDGTYNYPLDTPTYTVNNQTGVGVEGVVGDSGPSSNNTNGINEGSTAQENALGTTQHNSNGVLLNSTNGASTTTYFYP
jgi:hypothetical protein